MKFQWSVVIFGSSLILKWTEDGGLNEERS